MEAMTDGDLEVILKQHRLELRCAVGKVLELLKWGRPEDLVKARGIAERAMRDTREI